MFFHPIGYDAFGQPAENAAIKNKTNPSDWTYQCIDQMHHELKKMGFSYDWTREIFPLAMRNTISGISDFYQDVRERACL